MVVNTKTYCRPKSSKTKWTTQYKEIRQNRLHPYNYETATEKIFIHKIRFRILDYYR